MKRLNKFLFVSLFALILFGCSKKTTRDNTTSNTTTNRVLDKYSITLNNEVEGLTISGVTSGDKYDYNSEITLTASNIPSGNIIKWSRSDGVEFIGNTYKFNLPNENITITTTTLNCYTREGNKIYFGTYPQTRVTDDTLVSELNDLAEDLPSSDNLYNWTDYNYYLKGNVASYMFYQDIDYDNNGTYDYRGVYFTAYKPESHLSNAMTGNQNTNGYSTNTVYWFNYDPIEWNIITESDGKATLLANLILDSQEYMTSTSETKYSHNGGTGYANNYELSNIRKWLNDNFYNTAFVSYKKLIIQTTTVENGPESMGKTEPNDYTCNNTEDKVFFMSYEEITTHFTDSAARTSGTDYAKCQGLYVNDGYSHYWTRSPYIDYQPNLTVYYVNGGNGKCYGVLLYYAYIGVRPTITIQL